MEYSKNSIQLEGLSQIQDALDELPKKLQRNTWNTIFGNAMRKLVKPELDARLSENDKKYVKIASAKGQSKEDKAGMIIGIDADGYHLRFLEYGVQKRGSEDKDTQG